MSTIPAQNRRLSIHAAYTTVSGYAEFERSKGTLGLRGQDACGFIVLDRTLTAIPPEKILDTHVFTDCGSGKTV